MSDFDIGNKSISPFSYFTSDRKIWNDPRELDVNTDEFKTGRRPTAVLQLKESTVSFRDRLFEISEYFPHIKVW